MNHWTVPGHRVAPYLPSYAFLVAYLYSLTVLEATYLRLAKILVATGLCGFWRLENPFPLLFQHPWARGPFSPFKAHHITFVGL